MSADLVDVALFGHTEHLGVTVGPSDVLSGGIVARRGEVLVGHFGAGAVYGITPHQHRFWKVVGHQYLCACGAVKPLETPLIEQAEIEEGEE